MPTRLICGRFKVPSFFNSIPCTHIPRCWTTILNTQDIYTSSFKCWFTCLYRSISYFQSSYRHKTFFHPMSRSSSASSSIKKGKAPKREPTDSSYVSITYTMVIFGPG